MTSTLSAGVSAATGGHPALRRLVAADPATFAATYWGQRPLLSRSAELPAGFGDLFSANAVDELVSRRGLRTPFLRMARDGSTLPDRRFTGGGGVGAGVADQVSDDAVHRELTAGATLVLQGLHRVWEPVLELSQQLAADLGHPTQANAYVTPPQSTGFSDHYDVHDVFVLQVEGEKRWRIRPPVRLAPLRSDPWTDHRDAVERATQAKPLIETTLQPGDCLYLPRGFLHSATALGGVSIHLTIGVHPWTGHHLAEQLVRAALTRAAQDPAVRASLPIGPDAVDPRAHPEELAVVKQALHQAIEALDAPDLLPGLSAAAGAAQRAEPLSPLAQHRAAAQLAEDDVLRPRSHLMPRWERSGGAAVLVTRAGRLPLEDTDAAAVERFLETADCTAGELGVELARLLLTQGIAVPA